MPSISLRNHYQIHFARTKMSSFYSNVFIFIWMKYYIWYCWVLLFEWIVKKQKKKLWLLKNWISNIYPIPRKESSIPLTVLSCWSLYCIYLERQVCHLLQSIFHPFNFLEIFDLAEEYMGNSLNYKWIRYYINQYQVRYSLFKL